MKTSKLSLPRLYRNLKKVEPGLSKLTKNKNTRRVLDFIQKHKKVTIKDLSRSLGLYQSEISLAFSQLKENRLLLSEKVSEGRAKKYSICQKRYQQIIDFTEAMNKQS